MNKKILKYLNNSVLPKKIKKIILKSYSILFFQKYKTLKKQLKNNNEIIIFKQKVDFNVKVYNDKIIENNINHNPHDASPENFLLDKLQDLTGDLRNYNFMDAGCGTGKILYIASSYF